MYFFFFILLNSVVFPVLCRLGEVSTQLEQNVIEFVPTSTEDDTIILVLGSHLHDVLIDRVAVATEAARDRDLDNVTWFLSGGFKESLDIFCGVSEADEMQEILGLSENVEIERRSQNTAQNFGYFVKFLRDFGIPTRTIVVTSEFHFERAAKLLKAIAWNLEVEWILGKEICPTCWTDEKIHSRNFSNDVLEGLAILKRS